MNNLKHIAMAISALFAMGIASLSLASSCPTNIAPATSTCLSSRADATFQSNFNTEYSKLSAGINNSDYSVSRYNNNNANTGYRVPAPKQPTQQVIQPQAASTTTNNNNNTGNSSSIRWY